MPERGVPLLALALAAAASSRLQLSEETEARLRVAFTDAVAALDNADRTYRAAIESTLPHEIARTMLSAMAAFRECAHQVRESAMHEMREIYRRYNRPWDWLDPLDAYAAAPRGFSHADGTRIATIADRARSQADALRAQANESVAKELSAGQTQALRAAKLRRRETFTPVLREALERGLGCDAVSGTDTDKAVEHLTLLADGWY